MTRRSVAPFGSLICLLGMLFPPNSLGGSATLLFEDDFDRGIPGWTAVRPAGTYIDGPMRWQYDIVSGAFLEQSNIYTDAATVSPSATAPMLINDAVTGASFTYRARLTAGDDDAFGLIFGYTDADNFYRVTFTRQHRTDAGFPWNGWNVDRKVDKVATALFGDGTPGHVESFVNTQFQPFDVTITVTADNLLSLTVVDDPDGAAIAYNLVEAKPLPGPANGQVGLMTWGMSGTALRGFRISQPVLTPVALVGDPNALTAWTPVVPPRGDGSGLDPASGNGGRPIWSLALGVSGSFGTLHENSDSYGGNDAVGVVDFAAPTLVTGNAGWSNYVVTARIIPRDDDGHGILLRYQDGYNFYRVALRSQSSATGPQKGLSIQKVVAGVWEEVYRDSPVQFSPPSNVAYDITVAIVDNNMQVQIVGNPTGVAQVYSYGPFDLAEPTVPNGGIGLFSWGMSRTEFDFVRVYGIDGVPLLVSSAHGQPNPAVGLSAYPRGSLVNASVPSPIEEPAGMKRTVTGWTGLGSVPASGTEASVAITMDAISSLTWNWRTEVKLTVQAGAGGQVTAPADVWLPEGTNVVLIAQPDAGYMFTGWSGDSTAADPALALQMTRPLTVTAGFAADTDQDGLPDPWEQACLGGLAASAADDTDLDGATNLAEYQRGTHPNHVESVVAADGLSSRWENVQRDPALPGQLVVSDFGSGFRGAWENSNDYREAVDGTFIGTANVVPGVSFEGPRIVIRTNIWDSSWADITGQVTFSVGDNDGNCVYFRYQDERNWYRVTVCGENNNLDWRAPFGVTIQKRVNGVFTELGEDPTFATDPVDVYPYFKRVCVTVSAQGPNFEVRVIGWNASLEPAGWDPGTEYVLQFIDLDLPNGRFGVGTWGQSGGATATANNPVSAGALIEDVVLTVGGHEVFREDWEQVPLAADLPAGWQIPSTGVSAGTWQVTAHGTILQSSDDSTATTGTPGWPAADGEGPILLAPAPGVANYFLEFGFQPFDNDGIGFVYDFQDLDNYSRVLFVSEATADGRIPRGLNVSRKSAGVWSDVVLGDESFVYTSGVPFTVEFANNNGACRLTVRGVDGPALVRTWSWTGPASNAAHRYGLACWAEIDAHCFRARALSLPATGPVGDLRITGVSLVAGALVLNVENPSGASYDVERADALAAGSWTVVASQQTGSSWTVAVPSGAGAAFFRLSQSR